jgi:hypothetical protein
MTMLVRALLSAFLVSAAMPAFAIYKCEMNGKTTYGDAPCAGGQRIEVDHAVSGSGAQSRRELLQQKAELKRLEGTRHKQEDQQAKLRRAAARTDAAKQKKCASLARRKKWASEDAVTAAGKSAEKMRRKARRAQETYHEECGA